MPRIEYPSDLRHLAGELNDPRPVMDNLTSAEQAARRLDWENFSDSALSAEHATAPLTVGSLTHGVTKRVRSASINRLSPYTYTQGASGTWQNIVGIPIGPAQVVGSQVFRRQARVYLIGTLTDIGRWNHNPPAGPVNYQKPDEVHKIRFNINGVATRSWNIGADPHGYLGGAIHSFIPEQAAYTATLEFMAQWIGSPYTSPEIIGNIQIRAASLTAIEVYR